MTEMEQEHNNDADATLADDNTSHQDSTVHTDREELLEKIDRLIQRIDVAKERVRST